MAAVVGALLSLAMEILQASIEPRVPSLTDLSLNAAGALIGALKPRASAQSCVKALVRADGAMDLYHGGLRARRAVPDLRPVSCR